MASVLPNYLSSDSDEDQNINSSCLEEKGVEQQKFSQEDTNKLYQSSEIGSNLAPDISIAQLVDQKNSMNLQKFQTQNKIITKNNHMNGYVQASYIDQSTFDQQFNQFRNKRYSYDPSIAIDSLQQTKLHDPNKMFNPNRITQKLTASQRKKLRKQLKSKRKQSGLVSSNSFLGPWAGYVDDSKEDDLPSEQMAELTEQQKIRMKQFQEKRQIRTKELQQQQD